MINFFNNPFINKNNGITDNSQQTNNQSEISKENLVVPNENNWGKNKNEYPMEEKQVDINAIMDFSTLQKARQDLIGEIQAVIEYDDHIHNTTDKLAKETWENIKSEELTHVGELLGLINYLDPTQKKFVEQGMKEFAERMNKV